MSRDALRALAQQRAFNATPRLDDLRTLHVTFESMVPGCHVEGRLEGSARRGERVALIAGSGCGKSSLVSYVLGPVAAGVAPILVPVHALESDARRAGSVADAVIAQLRLQAGPAAAAAAELDGVLGDQREVAHSTTQQRSTKAGLMSWMSLARSREISQQTANHERIPLSAKIEVIEQCLRGIRSDALVPVFVFDDTDRWIDAEQGAVVRGFFGEGIRWLAELHASVVVATHSGYLDTNHDAAETLTFLDTRVEIPPVPSVDQLGRVLERRVQVHGVEPVAGKAVLSLAEVMTESAVEELFSQYTTRGSLRAALQIAHVALVEAADTGADAITGHHIGAATQAW